MKIAVRKVSSLGDLYNDKYGVDFFECLWKECLLKQLQDEEVVWFNHMPTDRDGFDNMLADFDAVIGAWLFEGMITDEMFIKHPRVKYISTISHGYSEFDTEACAKHGVVVTNTHFNDYAVAQHAMALLLEIAINIGINCNYYKKNKWKNSKPYQNKLFTKQFELQNRTIGIIGLGNIGYLTATMAAGFGMNVLANSRHTKEGEKYGFINQVDFESLIKNSDIISIHCPATTETKKLICDETIKKMKDGVIIINCARGDIIDEKSLLNALNTGKVYAAGLDVFMEEPLKAPVELLLHPNVVATEHIAWATPEARIRSVKVACENFFNWRNGTPTSVIS